MSDEANATGKMRRWCSPRRTLLVCVASWLIAAVAGASDHLAKLEEEVRQLRSEIQEIYELRSALVSKISDSPSEAAPGGRSLQTSGGEDERAQISWDGQTLNFESTAEGKSTKVSILGDLNITGDIYLNGELLQPTAAPTVTLSPSPGPCTPTATSSTSWNIAGSYSPTGGDYSSRWASGRGPENTLDGTDSGNAFGAWLGYADAAEEKYLVYDLGSVVPITGIQIGNGGVGDGDATYGVQETLLQSGTSLTGPWTTESTFTGASRAANRTRCVCFAFNVPV